MLMAEIPEKMYGHKCSGNPKRKMNFGWISLRGNFVVCRLCPLVMRLAGKPVIHKGRKPRG